MTPPTAALPCGACKDTSVSSSCRHFQSRAQAEEEDVNGCRLLWGAWIQLSLPVFGVAVRPHDCNETLARSFIPPCS